ncbi:plasmid mobilization protein [Paraburkholderia tropica]|uniref:plasmid mobilization protein n=1 Tax=Paraburkholderia tropica TaxID=92647 RepID=UPI002AB6D6FE|nr:hypothetical protein [Paraburkholderia tropica]
MEQQRHEAVASPLKKQAGQSGSDGNIYRRDQRIEIRLSHEERNQLEQKTVAAGYGSVPQYVRAVVLAEQMRAELTDKA